MWALIEDNEITRVFMTPKAFVLNDVQYPLSIFTLWSRDEKEAIGLYDVNLDNSNWRSSDYYTNGEETFTFADGVVTKAFGEATPRPMDELKVERKSLINQEASRLLQPTDWYVLRATDGGTAVPANVATYRAAIRTKANEMCDAIDAVADVDALAALYEYTGDPLTRPLGEWPTLGE